MKSRCFCRACRFRSRFDRGIARRPGHAESRGFTRRRKENKESTARRRRLQAKPFARLFFSSFSSSSSSFLFPSRLRVKPHKHQVKKLVGRRCVRKGKWERGEKEERGMVSVISAVRTKTPFPSLHSPQLQTAKLLRICHSCRLNEDSLFFFPLLSCFPFVLPYCFVNRSRGGWGLVHFSGD
jgi:hypothetical protein